MPPTAADDTAALSEIIEHVAHLLPAQGPISIFIHHNTLHAFESLPFEEAVVRAGEKFGCEPFLPEDEYRAEFLRGRIADADLELALREELRDQADLPVLGDISRLELRRRIARHGLPQASGPALSWLLKETSALRRYRGDLPPDAREALSAAGSEDSAAELAGVLGLWEACLSAARRSPQSPAQEPAGPMPRLRDLILESRGVDLDAWVHPLLIRLVAAFLDQGLAHWTLPGRERGLYDCFLDLYSHPLASLCGRWAAGLPPLLKEERDLKLYPMASLRRSLEALGVRPEERESYLEATILALRGWGGMVRQLGKRPDRVPARSLPASLTEFLAVRLLLQRAALAFAAGSTPVAEFVSSLRAARPGAAAPSLEERAWPLFHTAQLCGLQAAQVADLTAEQACAWEAEVREFSTVARRRVLHAAYERHLRGRLCDALAQHAPVESPAKPAFQAIFCLDEREESFRRHLEEVEPEAETLSTAGFFGVAMYYQGATDAHPRPLCPIAIRPAHFVEEVKADPGSTAVRWRSTRRRGAGRFGKAVHFGSATLAGGALVTALLGPLSIIPLVLRVLFPRWARAWEGSLLPLETAPVTRLKLDRAPDPPPIGTHSGYTKAEMAQVVGSVLRGLGAADRLAELVAVLGHGSVSLNNPHESAHDCGACGGGRGGPNARAFAQMANDPEVRALLAGEGLRIPKATWFVGAQRNTCDNSVDFYDLDLLPKRLETRFDAAAKAFARARRHEAHERCRRFESFPTSAGTGAAVSHVEARSHDLAQPRPEYGHATNAFCIVGRRERTRGLFLDRRAFLVSYDPLKDGGGTLETTLSAVVPVVAGISLEYYFSRVDPTGYGCGTKLPHNIACLLGVMDGAQSDLRTGLPWQMVEIHEPVRLFMVVECLPDRFDRVLAVQPDLRGLLERRWLFAACLDPDSGALWLREADGYRPWRPEKALAAVAEGSLAWYGGKRGHLPIAEVMGAASKEGRA
ncbi:MAG: DUF2309 domain-containing protein [Elusimicrobia bacterium]|nr:DUF2309 domain-containing protein [Elusimicrobiota bacterium]